ncbi:hypothetical protein GmHk_05G012729 [Glycine max]|nr:hypothetical protein GmHk_05G012729 [Glycine max]
MKLGSDTHSVDRVANDATIVVDVKKDRVEASQLESSELLVLQKCIQVFVEKKEYPLITLPEFTWVDKEVGTFFSGYNDKSDIKNLLSWLTIFLIKEDKLFLIALRTC